MNDVLALQRLVKETLPLEYPNWWFEEFCLNLNHNHSAIGCFLEDSLVGFIDVDLDYYNSELKFRNTSFEYQLEVESERQLASVECIGVYRLYQGHGIASKLIRLALEDCKTHRLKPNLVYLYTHKDNFAAHGLYKKMGFTKVHKIDGYYEDGDAFAFVKNLARNQTDKELFDNLSKIAEAK
ncbi:hypothetical protein L596_009462 [Steinernema carpocapsae]|uniref:N-alpha-acetyltransferase 60 n=1 Tax=Steinernema carpocapsae TaxID=34508 RepID=A0A4U5PG76_STECR|nr:hypothetical protein L596_009462 [Steinernema carpocapsae]